MKFCKTLLGAEHRQVDINLDEVLSLLLGMFASFVLVLCLFSASRYLNIPHGEGRSYLAYSFRCACMVASDPLCLSHC